MRSSGMHYFPLAWPFLLAFFLFLVLIIVLIEFRILRYAYERLGIDPRYVWILMVFSLLGSSINIPVAELPGEQFVTEHEVNYYGVTYIVPEIQQGQPTIIAVNVGGALIPTLLSLYLLVKNRIYLRGGIAVVVVAGVVHYFAQPIRGVGIKVPIFLPPI